MSGFFILSMLIPIPVKSILDTDVTIPWGKQKVLNVYQKQIIL